MSIHHMIFEEAHTLLLVQVEHTEHLGDLEDLEALEVQEVLEVHMVHIILECLGVLEDLITHMLH